MYLKYLASKEEKPEISSEEVRALLEDYDTRFGEFIGMVKKLSLSWLGKAKATRTQLIAAGLKQYRKLDSANPKIIDLLYRKNTILLKAYSDANGMKEIMRYLNLFIETNNLLIEYANSKIPENGGIKDVLACCKRLRWEEKQIKENLKILQENSLDSLPEYTKLQEQLKEIRKLLK